MSQFLPSDLKLEFSEIFLDKVLNFNENDPIYATFPIGTNGISTNVINSATNTAQILKDLNRYLECYLFTAMSSLDALAYEIFDKFNIKKLRRIYITIFDKKNANKNAERQQIFDNLNKKNTKILEIIQNFLADDDFKYFKSYRDFIAHKSILSKELSFDTKQSMDGAVSLLKRPIFLPEITEYGELKDNKLNLNDYLENFHEKIKNFHKQIKTNFKT